MYYGPPESQESIRKRTDAIDLLRREFDVYTKSTNLKIQLFENEKSILEKKIDALSHAHNQLIKDHDKSKGFICELTDLVHELGNKLNNLTFRFEEVVAQKANLAAKINDARKRLDATEKS